MTTEVPMGKIEPSKSKLGVSKPRVSNSRVSMMPKTIPPTPPPSKPIPPSERTILPTESPIPSPESPTPPPAQPTPSPVQPTPSPISPTPSAAKPIIPPAEPTSPPASPTPSLTQPTPLPAEPTPPPATTSFSVSAGSSRKPASAHPRRKSSVHLETKSEAESRKKGSFRSSRLGRVQPIEDVEADSYESLETVMETPRENVNERMPLKHAYLKIGIGLIVVIILLVIILVPLGYHELEYYEIGLYRNKMTGFVDTSKTYFAGRHWLGVNKNFVVYPADLQRVSYSNVSVFTTEKLEVNLTFTFTYQLRDEDLGVLYETFGDNYESQLYSAALSALKGAAIRYSIDDFKLNRPLIAKALSEAVALAIGGKCCRKDCFVNKCAVDCKIYWSCLRNDFGFFSVLRYFQLQQIDITDGQSERYLKQVLEKELEDKEIFQQDEAMVRLETEQLVIEYTNRANEMIVNATSNSTVFKLEAIAHSDRIIEDHRNRGLMLMYEKLNVTEEEHKKQLDYVMSLKKQNNASLYLDFQYVVARP